MERGFVLMTVLIFILLMTWLSTQVFQTAEMELHMSAYVFEA